MNCSEIIKNKIEVLEALRQSIDENEFKQKWGMSKEDAEKCLEKVKKNNLSTGITKNIGEENEDLNLCFTLDEALMDFEQPTNFESKM